MIKTNKTIKRLDKNDDRYKIIEKRHFPIWLSNNRWMFCFRFYDYINKRIFVMEHIFDETNNKHYLLKKEMIKYDDGPIVLDKLVNYEFDENGNCQEIAK